MNQSAAPERFRLTMVGSLLVGLLLGSVIPAQAQSVHPRLYLTRQRIESLRREILTTRAAHWESLKLDADRLARIDPPDYAHAIRDGDSQQLWEREVGNALPTLAMAWLLTGDPAYKTAVNAWTLAACRYPTWGGSGKTEGTDLAAGHLLFGLALVYDWMLAELDPGTVRIIHQTLLQHGARIYEAAISATGGRYWKDEYLQNHLWVNVAGLAAAGLAMPEEPSTRPWIKIAQEKFRLTEKALGSDGASHEGVGYWSYGTEYLLKYWALSADLLHEDISSPWWKSTAAYRIYLSLPRHAWTRSDAIVDLADCTRSDYYGPDYQLFNLAQRFHDGHAQWLALALEKARVTRNEASFLNLLWYSPALGAKSPADLPTLRHFADLGVVSARSDWSGDESLVVFKCGPPGGHDAVEKQFKTDPGYGHVHPDANHFVVFGQGEWLIRDDGYRWKETGQHNTLLVDGEGQTGEHQEWFKLPLPLPLQGEPTITRCVSTPAYDTMTADAAGAYPADAGLKRFRRQLIFIKPATLLVIDDIVTSRTRELELRFHPESHAMSRLDDAFILQGKSVTLRVEDLTPANVSARCEDLPAKDRDGKPLTLFTVAYRTRSDHWQNVTALTWSAATEKPPVVKLQRQDHQWDFKVSNRIYQFDAQTGEFHRENIPTESNSKDVP